MPIDAKLLAAAARHERGGSFQQAVDVYQPLVSAHPHDAALRCRLAAACIGLRQFDEAGRQLDEALRLDPALAEAHVQRGRLASAQGRFAEAAASFESAAALEPRNAAIQLPWAEALASAGQPSPALEVLEQTVRFAPDNVAAHRALGRLLVAEGRHADAAAALRRVAELLPDQAAAQLELGAVLCKLRETSGAIAAYRAALELKPDAVDAGVRLSALYTEQKLYDEAVRWARRAIELAPDSAEAHHNLGVALSKLGSHDVAKQALQTACRLNPDLKEAHINLGVAEAAVDRFDEAIAHYRQALAIDPRDLKALFNLGNALMRSGELAQSLAVYDQMIELCPDSGEAHFNRAVLWLLQGKLSEGFAEFQWRLRLNPDLDPSRPVGGEPQRLLLPSGQFAPWPIWQGEPLAGRTIVLCYEGGLGDTIHFVRYAPLLKQQGARVVVLCEQVLFPILARTPGIDVWLPTDGITTEADYCLPLMSLPYRFGTTIDTIPAAVPYVFADPELVEIWRPRLSELRGVKVGILWQGNRNMLWDRHRSVPLKHYAPLAQVAGVQLVNLQKGPGIEQLAPVAADWNVADFSPEVDAASGPFMDTAAIMKNLDLVITSDTSAAHLAGALGVPTWMAVNRVPDWRWLLDRDDCPWYPTMRVFRQRQLHAWPEVFERMALELALFVEEHQRVAAK